MGLRFKKSIKLGKGVKLNLGKKSAGISFGGKGHSTSINSKGRMTNTIGIPGTGLSYTSTIGGKKSKKGSSKSTAAKKKTQQNEAEPTWLEAFEGLLDLTVDAVDGLGKLLPEPKEYVPKEHSSKTYRTSGLALQIISPILFVLSLLLSLVFPFALILVALSVFLFVLGRKYKAKGKETEQAAIPVQSKEINEEITE